MVDRWWSKLVGSPDDEAWQQGGLYRIASGCLMLQHVLIVACGLAWFISPSGNISQALDPAWSGSWSIAFAVFAVVGAVARIRHAWPIEAAANIVIAISVWFWAMVILILGLARDDYSGLQTSLMLLGFAASLWGWSLTQISWVRRREAEGERLQRKVADLLAQRINELGNGGV